MKTDHHKRIRDCLDRYGKRNFAPKQNGDKATDDGGWKQEEFIFTSDVKYPTEPDTG